ncbi:MAG: transposase [Actinomycetota bacterium]|nr:transposase [Actinomycetota bacterium]
MTTEEAIRALFPKRVIQRAKRAVADPEAPSGPEFFAAHMENRCRTFLEQLRWPDGVRCPRCEASKGISRIESRGQFECGACGYQFSVRVGTIFHASHLPLWKWFLAVYIIGGSRDGVTANQLARMLGISYKTAWYLSHRIRAAMRDDSARPRRQMTEADEVARHRMGHKGKHLTALRDEQTFRAKNRGNRYLFRDLVSRLIGIDAMPYTRLISSA